MNEMVERVARDVNDRLPNVGKWDTLSEEMKDECRAVVRMVIEAMRTVEYDLPLNEAGWTMLKSMQAHEQLAPVHFNHIKPCLRDAFIAYFNAALT
jgi:hypothetical protein